MRGLKTQQACIPFKLSSIALFIGIQAFYKRRSIFNIKSRYGYRNQKNMPEYIMYQRPGYYYICKKQCKMVIKRLRYVAQAYLRL